MIHDTAETAARNQRLKPSVYADLTRFKASLVVKHKLGVMTRDGVMTAFVEALAQVARNPAAMMTDDREWTPVRCRNCGYTTSVLKDVSSWACRCFASLKREVFVDAIGPSGNYLLDQHAHVHLDSAAPGAGELGAS